MKDNDGITQNMALPQRVQYITDENGEKQSVILPVEAYEEILEDIQDLVAIAERKGDDLISLEELKKNLISDGLL